MDENQIMDNEIDVIINYIKQAISSAETLSDELKSDYTTIEGDSLCKNLQSGENAKNEISALKSASETVLSSLSSLSTSVSNYKNVDWSE